MKKILFCLLNLMMFVLILTSCKDKENYIEISDEKLLEKINLSHTQKYDLCTISYKDNNETYTANYRRINDSWDYSSWQYTSGDNIIDSIYIISCGAYYAYTNPKSQITIGETSYAWYMDGEKLKYKITTKYSDSLMDVVSYYFDCDGYLSSLSEKKSLNGKSQTINAKIKYAFNE